ncbi:pre-mRNA-splicing factor ATP-dependent RNA helicase DEAH7 [Tanacetum coccineum]
MLRQPHPRNPEGECGERTFASEVKAISSAYFHNAAKPKGIREYKNIRNGVPCHLIPTSALLGLADIPEYVVYHELILTTKENMQRVTTVERHWLAEFGPKFYSVKDSGTSMLEPKKWMKNEKSSTEEEL